MRQLRYVLYAAHSEHLDPVDCDSTVSYKIYSEGKYLTATVSLTDCSRKIEWGFTNSRAIRKVDKTIALLRKFRASLVTARRKHKSKTRK